MNQTLDEILIAAQPKPAPKVLCCPGCTEVMEQHDGHGYCAECKCCWTDGLDRTPVVRCSVR